MLILFGTEQMAKKCILRYLTPFWGVRKYKQTIHYKETTNDNGYFRACQNR
jgi:hypothetical protein